MIIPQIKFVFDRMKRASNIKKGVIELRITFNRKQKFITTGVKCFPREWDDTRESIKSLSSQEDNAMLMISRHTSLVAWKSHLKRAAFTDTLDVVCTDSLCHHLLLNT